MATKNVVILTSATATDPEPEQILEWGKKALPNVKLMIAHDAAGVIAQGVQPDEVDALVPWNVFQEGVEPFLNSCSEKKRLHWIHCTFAGIDRMLYPGLVEDDSITLTLTKGVYSSSLGEWVIAGIMYWEKFIIKLQSQQKAHLWKRFYNQELRGKTMAVVGFGSIGQDAARKATFFGIHVTGVRRRPVPVEEETKTVSPDVAERVVGFEKLMEVLPNCDYVALVLPLTAQSRGCFTREHFAAMKSSAIFVNIGRGKTVDYEALYDALHDHKIAAASLDVCDVEPLPADRALWDLDNVLISPHCADVTDQGVTDCAQLVKENLTRFAKGQELLYHADKRLGY